MESLLSESDPKLSVPDGDKAPRKAYLRSLNSGRSP